MKKNWFKKVLLTASLLSPIAIVAPVVLTSCSTSNTTDNSNNNNNNQQDSKTNEIELLNKRISLTSGNYILTGKIIKNNDFKDKSTIESWLGTGKLKDSSSFGRLLASVDKNELTSGTNKINSFDVNGNEAIKVDSSISISENSESTRGGEVNTIDVTLTLRDGQKWSNNMENKPIKFSFTLTESEVKPDIPTVKEIDFIKDLNSFTATGNDYLFIGFLDSSNPNLKDVETAKKWLTGSTKSDGSLKDRALSQLLFSANETLSNQTSSSVFKKDKELKKWDITANNVSSTNTDSEVTITGENNVQSGSSQKIKDITIKLSLKSGFNWKGVTDTSKTITFKFNIEKNSSILNPIQDFLKPSKSDGKETEYVLIGSDLSSENETWTRISRELSELREIPEFATDPLVEEDTRDVKTKRADLLKGLFEGIEFNEKTQTKPFQNTNTNDLSTTYVAKSVSEDAKEMISKLFKELNLLNIYYDSTSAPDAIISDDIIFGASLPAEILNLDYFFQKANCDIEITSYYREIENTTKTDTYKTKHYGYGIDLIFTLKDGNDWPGLQKLPIRVSLTDIFDNKTAIFENFEAFLPTIDDSDDGFSPDTTYQPINYNVEIDSSDLSLPSSDATDESKAIEELYKKLNGTTKASGTQPSTDKGEKPSLDNNHSANMDNSKFGVNNLLKFLVEKMNSKDFEVSKPTKTIKAPPIVLPSVKDLLRYDWFFSDRITSSIKVEKLTTKSGAVTNPSVPATTTKFKFSLIFIPGEGYGWFTETLPNISSFPISLNFTIETQ